MEAEFDELIDDLIADAEDEAGHPLSDEEIDSLVDELFAEDEEPPPVRNSWHKALGVKHG